MGPINSCVDLQPNSVSSGSNADSKDNTGKAPGISWVGHAKHLHLCHQYRELLVALVDPEGLVDQGDLSDKE